MPSPGGRQIHVLVVVPTGINLEIREMLTRKDVITELKYYQERGRAIQLHCGDYCSEILDKIDQLYADHADPKPTTVPFICVEGSSGMGKSQLAFALGGKGIRPWFYWPTTVADDSQRIYQNFRQVALAFNIVTDKDKATDKLEEMVLDTTSTFYETESLWTYGFILALLQYSCLDENQRAQMIHIEEKTFNVNKCDRNAVLAAREKMIIKKKVLPLFILDEMSPNVNKDGGMNLAAFQRNVFRVCGLVVIVMGTDVKVTNLVRQSTGSRGELHMWMTIVSRSPSYQHIPLEDEAMQDAWENVTREYPVVEVIAKSSRGWLVRCFVNSVTKFAKDTPTFKLCDLLDSAFECVSRDVQYSGYYDHYRSKAYSTIHIFKNCFRGKGFRLHANMNAMKKNYQKFENMVPHAIFCASRRNGVRGISFDDFFSGLLDEFQDDWKSPMTITLEDREIVASNLLEGYAAQEKLAATKIPFLAPPNALWPTCILDAGDDCNFGHLIRAQDLERMDSYVMTSNFKTLFVCECKHWERNVDSGTMKSIIDGLNAPNLPGRSGKPGKAKWNKWTVVLVFCKKLATSQNDWEFEEVGCVKVNCQTCEAKWINQPEEDKKKKLVVAMEIGSLL
ncbi:Crinkler (CRN) family protein [Phytophthora palmivora]|uniref:Crinkler (CRN) family protein n=1 Tax=Phytophthora palmivora TaxID=4796 RepID=A0A2P4XIX2_9STRA|nr:Crinkler (CRN) family protein [Phytophthora palmivora]